MYRDSDVRIRDQYFHFFFSAGIIRYSNPSPSEIHCSLYCRQIQVRVSGRAAQRPYNTVEVLVRAGRQAEDHVYDRICVATATGSQSTGVSQRWLVVAPVAWMHTVHKRISSVASEGFPRSRFRPRAAYFILFNSYIPLWMYLYTPIYIINLLIFMYPAFSFPSSLPHRWRDRINCTDVKTRFVILSVPRIRITTWL